MKAKFKDRYVLATGKPMVRKDNVGIFRDALTDKRLLRPHEFTHTVIADIPCYRLVLERVK